MSRYAFALIAATGFVSGAGAQPGNLPLSPGVRPASPIGPGTQFLPQPTPTFGVTGAGRMQRFNGRNNGFGFGYGAGYYGPGFGFGFPGGYYDYGPGPSYAPAPLVFQFGPPPRPEPTVVLANEFPATLTVQFPAAADVWFNGVALGDALEERVLISRVLKPGEQFAFDVKARWTAGGKTYESLRTVTLGPGDRSRLLVVSGTEVK